MTTYFPDVSLFDGRAIKRHAGVLVDDEGHIAWVGSHARAPKEARAALPVDTEGRTLTPGLIDAHVHLSFDGEADFVNEGNVTEPYAALKCVRNASRHLASGTTTVRDLGGPGSVVCEVAKAIDAGLIPGPRVVASGQALTISGGHGWNTFARQVDGPNEVRRAVREQFRAGARSIKIVATGGVLTPGVSVDFTSFTPEEVEAAVDEAHKWGHPITAHAIGATGIEYCVRAGVDSIEHGVFIDDRVGRMMKEQGTFRVATISALAGIVGHPEAVPPYAAEKGAEIMEQARATTRRMIRLGVRHVCGTDAGTPFNPHGGAPGEIGMMVEWGMRPVQALEAATANAAELLRVPRTGTIEVGKDADVVLWPGDPLQDVTALERPALVMRAGRVAS